MRNFGARRSVRRGQELIHMRPRGRIGGHQADRDPVGGRTQRPAIKAEALFLQGRNHAFRQDDEDLVGIDRLRQGGAGDAAQTRAQRGGHRIRVARIAQP
jgi:hypothetical protein